MNRIFTAAILGAILGTSLGACSPAGNTAPEPDVVPEPPVEIAGYGDDWSVNEFWSGEYPSGFTVQADNVSVMGRSEMKRAAPREIDCALPKGANYTPWNVERADADNLTFMSANQITAITLTQDIEVDTFVNDNPVRLALKTGDVLHYQFYMAEGFFMAEFEGQTYELSEGELRASATFEDGADTDEWVNVKCHDGSDTRAWLLLAETLDEDDIAQTQHDNYGTASDLVGE